MARCLIAGLVVVVVACGVELSAETTDPKEKDAETARLERLYVELAKNRAEQWSKEQLQQEIDKLISQPTDDESDAARQQFAKEVEELLADDIKHLEERAKELEGYELGSMAASTKNLLQHIVDRTKLWATARGKLKTTQANELLSR